MTPLTQRLSTLDLSQRILEMGQTGVYRHSIFEAFRPVATQRQIRAAIAQAKQFGLHSVAALRDDTLGTYYQVDATQYAFFQAALQASIPLAAGDNLTERVLQMTQILRQMLRVAKGSAIALALAGAGCLLNGQQQLGSLAWVGATSALGIWWLQHCLARKLL
ncbi:hypothetical protein XM38_015910 [Halomicronema hongdechloris C2206]|uniref:Uncharacterized protein n=1 Tax=Halomicronema hongdechloris C2206 TaxID=1641165 RepID=A0A1Z3HK13_9CYAN|nr:hypothetical protein [Halomicronema hongdechloris]ASC70651.1 hypothetical protein XM38_015910 [Halomicronema hongdechloris C2206]